VDDHFSVIGSTRQPEVRLDLADGKTASVQPVEERLDVFSGDHG
jgi:hypothetical protein